MAGPPTPVRLPPVHLPADDQLQQQVGTWIHFESLYYPASWSRRQLRHHAAPNLSRRPKKLGCPDTRGSSCNSEELGSAISHLAKQDRADHCFGSGMHRVRTMRFGDRR